MFRKLNEVETAMLKRLRDRGKVKGLLNEKKVRYDETGNFTVCLIKSNGSLYSGVAKANPNDNFSPEVGRNLAFTRAVTGH